MSDGSLSQEEIAALLRGSSEVAIEDEGGSPNVSINTEFATKLDNIVQSTSGKQQSILGMLLSNKVKINQVNTSIVSADTLLPASQGNMVEVTLNFTGDTSIKHLYLYNEQDALTFASAIMGQEDIELNDMAINAIQESFAQISEPIIGALVGETGKDIIGSPVVARMAPRAQLTLPSGDFALITYQIAIGDNSLELHEIFDSNIVNLLQKEAPPMMNMPAPGGESMGMPRPEKSAASSFLDTPDVKNVQYPNFSTANANVEGQGNIGLLMDVYMEMTVELGRTRKLIKDILGIGEGTIIELDKIAGEAVDIMVNHKLIAKGEVVVIDENFGVRVTEIVSPMDRLSDIN